jgi:hypothetical protein
MSPAIRNCRFAFKCEKEWDALDYIGNEDVRFCQTCQKEVHFCNNDDELIQNIKLNRCVAFFNDNGQMLLGEMVNTNKAE